VATVAQNAGFPINVGDGRTSVGSVHKAWIIGNSFGITQYRADAKTVVTDSRLHTWKVYVGIAYRQLAVVFFSHGITSCLCGVVCARWPHDRWLMFISAVQIYQL